jgi:hypothetical protein
MHECAVPGKLTEEIPQPTNDFDQYSSVEISNNSISFSYHFKLWNVASTSMCILVKENSQILSQLKEGDNINMKYYTSDSLCPAEYRKTAIRHINKDDNGRFKGHYLVHLEILDNRESEMTCQIQTSH